MRTSSYVIYVDLPQEPDQMLLVHGYTGAYDKVSKGVATYVRSLEPGKAPKPLYGDWQPETLENGIIEMPSDETIAILRRRGYLTDLSKEQETELLKRIAVKIHQRGMQRAPGYIFMPTYNCNLRCSYCFQDHMRTNPLYGHLLRTMSPAIVDRIFAAMPRIEAVHGFPSGTEHRGIGFFGGEPLLAVSKPIIEQIINKTLSMGTGSFWAVTNATELDAYEDLLSPKLIGGLQITLDGPPGEHDKRRIYADGSGSFERIARNITMALSREVQVSVRLNLDRNNIGMVTELANVIYEREWNKSRHFSVYTAPIRASNEKTRHADTFDTWKLDQMLTAMHKQNPMLGVIGRPDSAIQDSARRIFQEPSRSMPQLKETFCSAHTGMYIFDAFADIYACWERTGDASIRIGHVHEGGEVEFKDDLLNLWRTRTVASNPVCSSCRYALHCGGGCAVLAQERTGEYHMNFCDGFASRFRANVAEAYVAHLSGAVIGDRSSRLCDQ